MRRTAYLRRKLKIERHNIDIQQKQELRNLRLCVSHKHLETNKLIAIYLFILFNVIIIYALVAMWKLGDLSYLGVLISDIAAQVLVYAIYCIKAYCGKREEERLRFERDKLIILPEDDIPEVNDEHQEAPLNDPVG